MNKIPWKYKVERAHWAFTCYWLWGDREKRGVVSACRNTKTVTRQQFSIKHKITSKCHGLQCPTRSTSAYAPVSPIILTSAGPLPVLKQGKTALTLAPYGLCIYSFAFPFARRTLFSQTSAWLTFFYSFDLDSIILSLLWGRLYM